jgi:glycosyltransferase involved in cell wall biosynthesis
MGRQPPRERTTLTITALAVVYPPVFSGPHNTTMIAAKLLEAQDVQTIIVVPDDPNAQPGIDRMRAAGCEVIPMPLHRTRVLKDPRVHWEYLRSLRPEVRALADLIRDRKVDVVANNMVNNIQGALAARKADVACVWELIDTASPQIVRTVYSPLVRRLSDVVMTTGVKVAEVHPGVTELGDRWITYFPCVDVERFRPSADVRKQVRAELAIPDDALVIGNVAAMSEMKGHRWFISAAAKIRAEFPNTRFVILGSRHADRGPYYESLWAQAESLGLHVGTDLIVQDPGSRVHELAQAFDVFWLTSEPKSEGIPTAIGEAKALQIPVVTTDVGSCSECVTPGESGFVVPPQDADAIAGATRPLLQDADLRRRFGVRGREEALQQYAAERGADVRKLAYERAIAHHAAHRRR